MRKPPIVYLPGLNTYADELFHLGPLTFGRMAAPWENAARARKREFIALAAVGPRPLEEEMRDLLAAFDKATHANPAPRLLLAHSTGGLVARAIAAQRPEKVAAIVTLGSPHRGAPIAQLALDFRRKRPGWSRAFRALGYDTEAKARAFDALSSKGARAWAERYPLPPHVACAYAECQASGAELCAPFRALGLILPETQNAEPTDGFVPVASQIFGAKLGSYRLDHNAEIGFFLHARGKARAQAQSEFARLAADVFGYVSN